MNERIIELIEESKCLSDGYNTGAVDLEKFAELIVKECASWVDSSSPIKLGNPLKKHFGVEE